MESTNWFKKSGWLYLPKNFTGFMILAVFISAALLFLKVADYFSENSSSLLMHFVPAVLVLFFSFEWIAKKITITQ